MKSFLDPDGGLFTPGKRFAFTNVTDEDFTSYFSKMPIVVKAGETIEISDGTPVPGMQMGHFLAIKLTGELVDKIMLTDVKVRETDYYKANPAVLQGSYRAPNSVGIPAARKPHEDAILKPLGEDEESPAIAFMRKQLQDEIEMGKEGKAEALVLPSSLEEFPQIKRMGEAAEVKEVKPIKTKKIETSNSPTNKGK